mmetsp:Transcript_11067/g.22049  ORF Transcript_11067/g.22049 Transcript_11067/m.22049 type:complete len:86 (-) Transcript_11067:109-366(-)
MDRLPNGTLRALPVVPLASPTYMAPQYSQPIDRHWLASPCMTGCGRGEFGVVGVSVGTHLGRSSRRVPTDPAVFGRKETIRWVEY